MPLHLGAFVLSINKQNMNTFIQAINGFYTNDVYDGDVDSLYIENKHWDKLDKGGHYKVKTTTKKTTFGRVSF